MKGKNCPNCGAVYEPEKNKCPYCGTSYYDMSALNFESSEPFYLKIKTHINGKPAYITQLVKPCLDGMSMDFSTDYTTVYGGYRSRAPLWQMCSNQTLNTNISFRAISMKNNNLCIVEVEDE